MGKKKQQRYAEIKTLPNVIESGDQPRGRAARICGNWNSEIFNRQAPLILELACGKGEYALALAEQYPDCNIIGIDVKGDRVWKGATQALEKKLQNVYFLRAWIDHLTEYFAENEVSEIWITFPDPFAKKSKQKRRLTHPVYLERYQLICKPGSRVHLKTDDHGLAQFTLRMLKQQQIPVDRLCRDVHNNRNTPSEMDIITYYEHLHIQDGKTIKYVSFRV